MNVLKSHLRVTIATLLERGASQHEIGTPADETHVAFRILNEGGSNQTFDYEGSVRGD